MEEGEGGEGLGSDAGGNLAVRFNEGEEQAHCAAVVEAGSKLGLDETYIPYSYIEQVQYEEITEELRHMTNEMKVRGFPTHHTPPTRLPIHSD